jgi:hypothetical protein
MADGFIYNNQNRAFYYDELSSMDDAEEFLYHNFSYDIEKRRKDVSYQDIWNGVQDLVKYFEIFGMGPMLRNIVHLETIVETYREVFHNENFAVWNYGGIVKLFKNFVEKHLQEWRQLNLPGSEKSLIADHQALAVEIVFGVETERKTDKDLCNLGLLELDDDDGVLHFKYAPYIKYFAVKKLYEEPEFFDDDLLTEILLQTDKTAPQWSDVRAYLSYFTDYESSDPNLRSKTPLQLMIQQLLHSKIAVETCDLLFQPDLNPICNVSLMEYVLESLSPEAYVFYGKKKFGKAFDTKCSFTVGA